MNVLFIDTSYDFILVSIHSIQNQVETNYSFKETLPRESSFRLVSEISTAMEKACIQKFDAIACCVGPGSFTGIRIGVSTARNLSQLWKIPILGINSLELYACYYYEVYKKNIQILLNGKQSKLFTTIYDGKFNLVRDIKLSQIDLNIPETINITDLENLENSISVYQNLPEANSYFKKKQTSLNFISDYEKIIPNYMRESYAKK